MSHQPFEDWILDDEALNGEEQQALDAHRAVCASCSRLGTARTAVDSGLRQAGMIAPPAGFAARFSQRLAEQRVRDGRRQAWGTFALAAAAAGVVAIPLVLRLSQAWMSPGDWVVQMLIRLYDAWVGLCVALGFVQVAWNSLPNALPPAWVLAFVAACLGMVVIWIATLYRFAFRRVTEGA
jgi:hypothetical protein